MKTGYSSILTQHFSVPMLVIAPEKLTKKESETAKFTCSILVSHPTKIYWDRFVLNSHGYKEITEGVEQTVTTTKEGTWRVESILKVDSLDYYDGGSYRCSVKEYPVSAQALLFVQRGK